jgi:hypothetical protein
LTKYSAFSPIGNGIVRSSALTLQMVASGVLVVTADFLFSSADDVKQSKSVNPIMDDRFPDEVRADIANLFSACTLKCNSYYSTTQAMRAPAPL